MKTEEKRSKAKEIQRGFAKTHSCFKEKEGEWE